MITIREATGADAPGIRDVFAACYGADYPYPQYYDVQLLTKLIYSDDTLLLAAVDTETDRVLGTASVILQVGAYGDLVGEFGRLAVHPDARHRGVGTMLMEERLRRVQNQLHVGLIEGRVAHPYTLKIAQGQQFAVIGFLPQKMLLRQRESLALMVRYFAGALALRNNNPRIIPEAYPLAHLALESCALPVDAIVDEESAPYPYSSGFLIQQLTTEGYATLLRIERGRVRNREIFGPMRLHYGFFKLQARKSNYLLAREAGRIAGAVGFMLDPVEKAVRVFELITLHDDVIRFLLSELERHCREEWGMAYIEVDVSAYAPRMQRTLLELNFLPAAYVPALVFHHVERLDVVKMVRLLCPLEQETLMLSSEAQAVADVVLRGFRSQSVLPRIAQAVGELPLFAGLNAEQVHRLAGVCSLERFGPQETIFAQGSAARKIYLLLNGEAAVVLDGDPVARVTAGECLGEMAVVTGSVHSATAIAQTAIEAAVLTHEELTDLIRRRPDIGLLLYKNVAAGMAQKLRRSDRSMASGLSPTAT
jgi:GNAT superfamily N-acetyltransferase